MKRYGAVFAAAVPGAVALLFMLGALAMPAFGKFYQAPGFFPLVVGGCMLLFSVLLVIEELGKVRSQKNTEEAREKKDGEWWLKTFYIIGAMVFLVAMVWLRVSFMLSSAVFLAATLFFYARKRLWSNVFLILAVSVGLYCLFTRIFYIPLP